VASGVSHPKMTAPAVYRPAAEKIAQPKKLVTGQPRSRSKYLPAKCPKVTPRVLQAKISRNTSFAIQKKIMGRKIGSAAVALPTAALLAKRGTAIQRMSRYGAHEAIQLSSPFARCVVCGGQAKSGLSLCADCMSRFDEMDCTPAISSSSPSSQKNNNNFGNSNPSYKTSSSSMLSSSPTINQNNATKGSRSNSSPATFTSTTTTTTN